MLRVGEATCWPAAVIANHTRHLDYRFSRGRSLHMLAFLVAQGNDEHVT